MTLPTRSHPMTAIDPILFELDAATGVAVLTLNRPERFNAFTRAMITTWRQLLDRVEHDPAVRALVLTGQGKAFCAGGDMDELESFLAMDALELLWTGDPIDAETALRIGLVNHVVPAGTALAQARALAERIARQPTQAVRLIKRAATQALGGQSSLRAHLDAVSSHMAVLEDLPEFRQRVEAFLKRPRSTPT